MSQDVLLTNPAQRFEFENCYAALTAGEFTIGNAWIERRWQIKDGLLYASSFRDRTLNYEWLARPTEQPSPYFGPGGQAELQISARTGQASPVEAPSLVVELVSAGTSAKITYRFQIFPAARGVTIQTEVENSAGPTGPAAPELSSPATGELPSGIEQDEAAKASQAAAPRPDILEQFELADRHVRLTQIIFRDQTDDHNELIFENEWLLHPSEKLLRLEGSLFRLENTLTGAGLIFLKQAPLPYARPVKTAYDFEVAQTRQTTTLTFCGHGLDSEPGAGYPAVALAYTNGRYVEALQTYQRQLRFYHPQRDGQFLTNTWGDRGRDGRISENFLKLEIEAASRLGADVIQIDDGWQYGTTANSVNRSNNGVWEDFWAANQAFWSHHPDRLPNGLAPLIASARQKGLKFGLWFAPDSTNDFANWSLDAATIVNFYRELGINFIKIDAVKLRSKAGERNLGLFYKTVMEETGGEVVFDTDVTAEVRPGYLGQLATGPIFIENRYTDWHNYFPHQTLRNLWKLAHYIDPLRMRIEFLNHTRHTDLYANDLLAPATYSPAYLFAITMFASPLGWFEVSNLPPRYFEEVAPLASLWKAHRQRLAQGIITPLGHPPDGTQWTGFASVNETRGEGYLLVFRELNDRKYGLFELPVSPGKIQSVGILWGNGLVRLEESGVRLEIDAPQQFLFVHFTFTK